MNHPRLEHLEGEELIAAAGALCMLGIDLLKWFEGGSRLHSNARGSTSDDLGRVRGRTGPSGLYQLGSRLTASCRLPEPGTPIFHEEAACDPSSVHAYAAWHYRSTKTDFATINRTAWRLDSWWRSWGSLPR